MPNEISAIGQPGLSLTARLVQGATQVGAAITMTEAPSLAGHYTGSVPGGTAAGVYSVQVLNGGLPIAAAELRWDGSAEVRPALPSDVPTASTTAAAVRSNLAAELGRIDVAVSTRESEASAATRASANQTEHDATQAAVAALPVPPNSTAVQAAAAAALAAYDPPTHAEMTSAITAIGDPLTRPVPGTYPAGSAGEALGKLVVGPADEPAIVLPGAPATEDICRVYGYIEGADNQKLPNVTVMVELLPANAAVASERLVAGRKVTLKTDAQGRLIGPTGDPWVDLQRTDLLAADGSADIYYEVTSAALGVHRRRVELTTQTADLRTLLITPAP